MNHQNIQTAKTAAHQGINATVQDQQERTALHQSITDAVEQWFTSACQNPAMPLFVFYEPHAIRVAICSEKPAAHWELATPTPVSCAFTKHQAWQFTKDHLLDCPTYPTHNVQN